MSTMVSDVKSTVRLQPRPADRAINSGPPAMSASIIAAGVIGHALEWYDFAIYGYLGAAPLSRVRPRFQRP